MDRDPTRRGLLRRLGTAALASAGLAGVGSGRPENGGFDPGVHGFGFRNWSTREATYPEHDHDSVAEEEVRRVVGRQWGESLRERADVNARLPAALVDAVARQVYVSVNQQSATNGHCYGMVFAAQQYYERPATLPGGAATAGELTHPERPSGTDAPSAGREIDVYQLTQFLNVNAWLGRRAMVRPSWIRYAAQLEAVTAVVDEFGTAGITLFDAADRRGHQVLVYDYRRDADLTELFVYDPNYPARRYANGFAPTVEVDTAGDRPTVRPYGDGYGEFVFNRRDRVVAAQAAPAPGSLLARDPERLRERATRLALFVVDAPGVSLTVVGPDDRPLGRDSATYMDRGASAYAQMRYRYGFAPGTYRVRIVGREATDYTLEALVADGEARLDATASRSIDAGEVHRYAAEASADGTGSLGRESAGSSTSWLTALAGAGLGSGVAGGYAYLRRRGGDSAE